MEQLKEIKDIMEEYIELLEALTEFEQRKFDALKAKDMEKLDTFLKEEQVHFLQLRGLDSKREKLLKEAGLEGKTYRQLLDLVEPSLKQEFQHSFDILSDKTDQLKDLIRTINIHIELQLHTIDTFRDRLAEAGHIKKSDLNSRIESGIYSDSGRNSAGHTEPSSGHIFKSRKI